MRGDLHHHFAREVGCNRVHGKSPTHDVPSTRWRRESRVRSTEDDGFEPRRGKHRVARARPYFFCRSGNRGDWRRPARSTLNGRAAACMARAIRQRLRAPSELSSRELQGNRNLMIDRSDWATRLDFAAAWAVAVRGRGSPRGLVRARGRGSMMRPRGRLCRQQRVRSRAARPLPPPARLASPACVGEHGPAPLLDTSALAV